MATPSEARVSVEVIATSNHFTQPLSVTHTSIHRRAINCRDRVDMTHSFRVHRTARRPSRPCAARWDMTLRSHEGHCSPVLSKWVGPMASTRSPLERATCGSRSTLAADTSGNLASVFPPFFKQVAWASESRNRALLYSQNDLIPSYDKRHGLHRPWEGDVPSARSARIGRGRKGSARSHR